MVKKHSAVRNSRAQLEELFSSPRSSSTLELLDVAEQLWSQLDTPLSLGLSLLSRAGQIEDILRVDFDPTRYPDWDVQTAADDHQAVAFLRKAPLEDVFSADAREAAAWNKFLEAEEQCRQTNSRFRARLRGETSTPAIECILHLAQQKIAAWLGTLDPRSWALRCRFGPGADNLTQGSRVSPYHKLSELSSTEDFLDGAARLALDHPSWKRYLNGIHPVVGHGPVGSVDVLAVPGNRITFVPKTALIDRSIAIEPRMNIFAQLGLGALIRSRLKRIGLDLDTQEPSRELAWVGSRFGTVATLDLSSASDTLAREVVRDLLPLPWLTALEWVRSKSGTYRLNDVDHVVKYEKFSSMGNGYTFELESMIFYALALACCDYCRDDSSLVRVFGDDIAYPARSVEQLVKALEYCGFTVNPRKSFASGPFRESCGADFFNGVNVRPYFQKESLSNVESLFRLANGIRRAACRRNRNFGCDGRYRRAWVAVIQRIPSSLRLIRGPFRLKPSKHWVDVECDDGYLASELDEAMSSRWVRKAPNGLQGWYHPRLDSRGRADIGLDEALVYIYALYSSRDGSSSEHKTAPCGAPLVPIRGNSKKRRLTLEAHASEWLHVGGWL